MSPAGREVTITIDGREVAAVEGEMLHDAARKGDVEIPYFCYEPKLGQPVGACRMCLVEIEGIPKLQTSCSTPIREGMVVNTTSDRSFVILSSDVGAKQLEFKCEMVDPSKCAPPPGAGQFKSRQWRQLFLR